MLQRLNGFDETVSTSHAGILFGSDDFNVPIPAEVLDDFLFPIFKGLGRALRELRQVSSTMDIQKLCGSQRNQNVPKARQRDHFELRRRVACA